MEQMPQWEKYIREAMNQLPAFLREFEEAKKKGTVPKSDPRTNELPDLPIRIHIERPDDSEAAQATLQVDVTLGRRFWLGEMRRLPTVFDDVVCRHMWTIVEPAAGMEWPLTDHPVLRLNYRGPQQCGADRPHDCYRCEPEVCTPRAGCHTADRCMASYGQTKLGYARRREA